jgi:hypothetical protein
MDALDSIARIAEYSEQFLRSHATRRRRDGQQVGPISGDFSLYRDAPSYDLYGTVDGAYVLHTTNRLTNRTDRASRQEWASRILACQAEDGWFSRRNLRGHPREHATAYAIGALRLLEVEPDEHYVDMIKPLTSLLPILTDHDAFRRWIERLGFRFSVSSLLQKNLGWHCVWGGSHLGGGVAAAVGMARSLLDRWWPGQVDVDEWFTWYFDWLDVRANSNTGYWQRAFWNLVYRKPTMIDLGGAVHFFWVYESLDRPFPYPEETIQSTLQLQRPDGLYADHPFCIDLDADFCLIRSYLQLSEERQETYRESVYRSVEDNFEAVISRLTERPLSQIYSDSHGLPGALAALVECTKLPGFKYAGALSSWQHPLDRVWWL